MSKILEALSKLDVANDNHWTGDGLPRIDTVRMLASNPGIGRDDITKEAPDFSRQNAVIPTSAPTVIKAVEPTVDAPQNVVTEEVVVEQVEKPEDLDEQIAVLREKLDEANQYLSKATEYRAKVQNELDDLINLKESSTGARCTMTAIQCYLKSQQGILNDRARRTRALQESGVTIADIQALIPQGAPIDAALRQKR